jgi:hypothetical protein
MIASQIILLGIFLSVHFFIIYKKGYTTTPIQRRGAGDGSPDDKNFRLSTK